jgi:7,8-dihydropterin-6-yl-methyl-4-(beta-D-ribofuranosyl)aminobenzene 5'-phosphate synthase
VSVTKTEGGPVITIVFDNSPGEGDLIHGWGFAAVVQWKGNTLLFDTGNEGGALLSNLRSLGVSVKEIPHVLLSHAHGDHAGGLRAFLEANPEACVYLLHAFPRSLRLETTFRAGKVVELDAPQEILPGMWSTGELDGGTPEQALVIDAPTGLVVITGCAHPGIESIVTKARELSDKPVLLALGGFHLLRDSRDSVEAVGASLQRMGVENLGACHCTGPEAIQTLRDVFGERFVEIRTGTRIDMGSLEGSPQ